MRIELKSVPSALKIEGIVSRSRMVNVGDAIIESSRIEARAQICGGSENLTTNWAVTYRSEDGAFIGNDSESLTLVPTSAAGHAVVSIDISVPEGAAVAEIEIAIEQAGMFASLVWKAFILVAFGILVVWLVKAVLSLF